MRKRLLSALLALCLLFSASACSLFSGGSGGMEDKYVAAIERFIDAGDEEKVQGALKEALSKYPESEKLLALQARINDEAEQNQIVIEEEIDEEESVTKTTAAETTAAETTAAQVAVPTEAQVEEQFFKMRELYRKWFACENLTYNESLKISIPNPDTNGFEPVVFAYRVTDPMIGSLHALRSAFLEYCTPDYFDMLSAGEPFEYCGQIYLTYLVGPDNGLYIYPGMVGIGVDDYEIRIQKLSDDNFEVRYWREVLFNDAPAGVYEYDECVQNYFRTQNGYRFGKPAVHSANVAVHQRARYIVATKSSALNVHNVPSDSKESIIGTIPKGTIVESSRRSSDWVVVSAVIRGEEIAGWVSAKYLQFIE